MTSTDWIAIAGILGTLVGTLIGVISSIYVQKISWRRQDAFRFVEEKRCKYAEFLRLLDQLMSFNSKEFDSHYEDFSKIWSELSLIASKEVFTIGEELWNKAKNWKDKSSESLFEKIRRAPEVGTIVQLRYDFENAARRDLGIQLLHPEDVGIRVFLAALSFREIGDEIKIKLKNGSEIQGRLKSKSDSELIVSTAKGTERRIHFHKIKEASY